MAKQQMQNFFLPFVILITVLLYIFWPETKHEIIKQDVSLPANTEPYAKPRPTLKAPTSPPANAKAEVALASPTNHSQLDPKITDCFKKIRAQMQEQKKPATPPRERLQSRRYRRFTETLAKAGLMNDMKAKSNPEQALRRLSRMARRDPQNSAPLLFSAAIEFNRGNTLKAQEFLARARSTTTRFDTYMKSYSQDLLSQVSSPAELMNAYETLGKIKTPDYSSLQKMLTDLNQPELARQMISDGLDDRKVLNGIDWVPTEYGVGRNILDNLGEAQNYPSYNELYDKKEIDSSISADRVGQQLEKECDLNSLSPLVEQLKKELSARR